MERFVLIGVLALGFVMSKTAIAEYELAGPTYDDALPQFGRVCVYIDKQTGERKEAMTRTVYARLYDYGHACVKRKSTNIVTTTQFEKWKRTRYVKRSMSRFTYEIHKQYLKKLSYYEEMIALVAAECYRCRIKAKFSDCILIVNKLYSQEFDRKWEGLPKWKKYRVEFDGLFAQIDESLHSVLDRLDCLHKAEFENWKAQNHADYAARQKIIDDRERGTVLTAKMNRSIREAEAAKREAMAAKRQAEAATAAAWDAAAEAAEATRAARRAEAAARDAEAASWR